MTENEADSENDTTATGRKEKALAVDERTPIRHWIETDSIFPAYQVTNKSFGLVLQLGEEGTGYIDDILDKYGSYEDVVVDSGSVFVLRRNEALEKFLLKDVPPLYAIGLKRNVAVEFKDVVYHEDQEGCLSNFVLFRFKDYDLEKNGPPLLCTTSPWKIEPCYCEELNDRVRAYEQAQKYDYTDVIPPRVYARKDSLVLSYSDDFAWSLGHCLFPYRKIYKTAADGTVNPVWTAGLDLFGIPCD